MKAIKKINNLIVFIITTCVTAHVPVSSAIAIGMDMKFHDED